MTIAYMDQLIVETDADEVYATQIRLDLPAVMQHSGETLRRDGRVSRVLQRIDPATGRLAVELGFAAPVQATIGLTVNINIIVDSVNAAVTAPRTAIKSDAVGDSVSIDINGIARPRPISVIDCPAARLIVIDGMAPRDLLIRDATALKDGHPVQVRGPLYFTRSQSPSAI